MISNPLFSEKSDYSFLSDLMVLLIQSSNYWTTNWRYR